MAGETVLTVTNLKKHFDLAGGVLQKIFGGSSPSTLKAVDGVNFSIVEGETFSLIGELGSGKTTVAKMVVGLYPSSDGSIEFKGKKISGLSRKEMQPLRNQLQMIFQDPYASLDPRWRAKDIVAEPIKARGSLKTKQEIDARVEELLTSVGLSPADGRKYPHEFSGGQRQRISIARALASEPDLLVCDEPTSALDVSVQAQILNLMKDLQRKLGLTYLFISHDLAVIYFMSDWIGVMYLGRLVEIAQTKVLFENPAHPYTQLLLEAIPDLEMAGRREARIMGEVPNPINPPSGCYFHPRCPLKTDRCKVEQPELRQVGVSALVACHEAGKAI